MTVQWKKISLDFPHLLLVIVTRVLTINSHDVYIKNATVVFTCIWQKHLNDKDSDFAYFWSHQKE